LIAHQRAALLALMNNEQLFQYLDERIVSLNGQDAIVKELQHLQELLSENGAEKLPARLI